MRCRGYKISKESDRYANQGHNKNVSIVTKPLKNWYIQDWFLTFDEQDINVKKQ